MKITKLFLEHCWNMGESPRPIDIQEYRFLFFSCSLPADKRFNKSRSSYLGAFSYTNLFGTKKLMDERRWKEFQITSIKKSDLYIFETNGESKKKWNIERDKEIELFKKGKLPRDKIREEYFDNPYIEIDPIMWDSVKIGKLNELKIFHFILWHKVNGPYPVIKTSVAELKNKLMMGNSEYELKRRITKILKKYKDLKIIESFKWIKHNLEIEKGISRTKKGISRTNLPL